MTRPRIAEAMGGLAAAAGIASLAVHLAWCPSAGTEGLGGALRAALDGGLVLGTLVLGLAGVAMLGAGRVRRCGSRIPAAVWAGLALPALAPLLEPWSWRCAAPELALLGAGVLLLSLGGRADQAGGPAVETGESSVSGWRGPLGAAALAMAVGLLLLPGWPEAGGDEPHYLLAARSLWVDGDLDLADDYTSGEYRAYWSGSLAPHAKPGLDPATRYSTHGFGYPALLVPAIALGGDRHAVLVARLLQVGWFAAFAAALFAAVRSVAGTRAAWAGTLASIPLAPLAFASLALFPETPVMALACAAFLALRSPTPAWRAWAAGGALAALPWLAMKAIPLAGALAAGGIWRARGADRRRVAAGVVVPLAVSAAVYALLLWSLYGTVSPVAIYVGASPDVGRHTAFGADWSAYLADGSGALAAMVGHLLDQKEGLLALAPHLVLAAVAVPWLWRRRRHDLLMLTAAWWAHALPYGLAQEIGGQSIPVRPLLPVVWVAVTAVGVALTRPLRPWAAALAGGLFATSAAITLLLARAPGLLSHDYSVRMSRTLLALSPRGLEAWRAFPRWLNSDAPWSPVSLLWLVAVVALAVVLVTLGTQRAGRPGTDARWTFRGAAAGLGLIAMVSLGVGAVPLDDSHLGGDVGEGMEAWVPQYYPETAWVEPAGVWVRPGDERELVLGGAGGLETLRLVIRVLVPTTVRLQLGAERIEHEVLPDTPLRIALRPPSGRRWRGSSWWLLRVQAETGARPASLSGGDDFRLLGAYLRIVRAESTSAR